MHEPPVLHKYLKLFVEKAFRDLLSLPLLAWSERLSDNMMGRLDSFKKHWHYIAQNVVQLRSTGRGLRPTADIQRLKLKDFRS